MLNLLPLPITWLGFYSLGRLLGRSSLQARQYTLVVASIFLLLSGAGLTTWSFYVGISLIILMSGEIVARIRSKQFGKIFFIIQILGIVLMIVVFLKWRIYFQKYFVYLPSLSYLGFRGIAYLTSIWKRGRIDISAGLMQMLFFPMLFMGPISRVENFEQEYWDYKQVVDRLAMGLSMLIAGFLCGQYVIDDLRLVAEFHRSRFWLGALANSFEFYFTFAGYSHLIIGLGLLVGFKLPENFNNPYLATSISDFWRRWHMSLSFWIRDYVYIPLGGNRKGVIRKCFNVILAMIVFGIWHGLETNYLVWGAFHGGLLAAESVAAHFRFEVPLLSRSRPLKIVMTFLLVTFSWLIFKYPLPEFVIYVKRMLL